jgi:hypothetical protein
VQTTPSRAKGRRTVERGKPFSINAADPLFSGGDTGGPPLSAHSIVSRVGSFPLTVHFRVTRPLSTEKAPYFAALVPSS